MAIIRPFKALRPFKGIEQCFSCLPYDVLEEDEVKEIIKRNPNSFLKVTRAEVEVKDNPKEDPYEKAKENFQSFIERGSIVQDDEEAFYIYQEIWRGISQTGFFATVSVEEYKKGIIKKHELTRKDKEDDRTNHILNLKAQTGPVFLSFKSKIEIKNLINSLIQNKQPLYNFCDENNINHKLWKISEKENIEKLKKSFEEIDYLYIVDGHHRAAAAVRVQEIMREKDPSYDENKPYNFFMAAIFPHDELRILPYHRIVKDLNGLKEEEFLKKLETHFKIEKAPHPHYSPEEMHTFGIYLRKTWYKLTFKGQLSNDPVENLDVQILQKYILGPVLSIEDPRSDPKIYFIGGIKGIGELEKWVDEKGWKVAFSMYPTQMKQLFEVADSNKIMPPKSTWFEPKLRSGLLIHKIS